ncbi:YjcZ family sporulation protein [Caldalkalibacillus thermarum TA2.A1]|uniref:YjcZ family sporulation protein n=1 Tax=Caldalkalibacillus thermarum (strain TA2.A1) TaxID=986075 RepID=A0A8X8I2E6_CALTT|nr:YjcZ family sporulation protein [Caldalkalibacillus thermarum TA2.A1]
MKGELSMHSFALIVVLFVLLIIVGCGCFLGRGVAY